jgi:hypothetical protein
MCLYKSTPLTFILTCHSLSGKTPIFPKNLPRLFTDASVIQGVVGFPDDLRPPEPRRGLPDHLGRLGVGDELVDNDDPWFEADDLNFAGAVPGDERNVLNFDLS